jgi:hypothetical protein
MAPTLRQSLQARAAVLKNERQSWDRDVREIVEQMVPYRVVWDWNARSERNKGERKEDFIINSTPVRALDTLKAGMQAGITNPAREWFGITVSDKELAKSTKVKTYLEDCKKIIKDALHKSNWYDVLGNAVYPDLGSIATACVLSDETPSGGLRYKAYAWGQYWLDADAQGKIDTFFGLSQMTVRQVVQEFGIENVGEQTRAQYERGEFGHTLGVYHAIYPHSDRKPGALGPDGMAFKSCWWEETNPNKDQLLRESGYYEFPILAPRWSVRPGDVYGRGPGWAVRGDCKQLQHLEKRKLQMIDKATIPPIVTRGTQSAVSLLPGAVTELDDVATAEVKPLLTVPAGAISEVREEIAVIEARIEAGFYANLWQATLADERNDRPTATEVEAKRQEIMLMLGPLLQQLNSGLLEPAIERAFAILERNDMLPLPPDELQGADLTVEFISIMHQAQQSTGVGGLRSLVAEAAGIAQLNPDAIDKLNIDNIIDQFATMYGVATDAVRGNAEVAQLREARAQQQQAADQAAAIPEVAKTAQAVSQIDADNLGSVAGALGPVVEAQQQIGASVY